MLIKRNSPGRPRTEEIVPESQEMLDDVKLLYQASIYTMTEKMRDNKCLNAQDNRQLSEIAKVLMLMIKDERAARKEDDINSLSDDELEELANKANKQINAKKRKSQKEINEQNTESDPKS
jgi:hypothetical protein